MHPLPPQFLYFGLDKRKRFKLFPLPNETVRFEHHGEYHQWYGSGDCGACKFNLEEPDSYGMPIDCGYKVPDLFSAYSIRSVVTQLGMQKVISCHYFSTNGSPDRYGNLVREEGCMDSCPGCDYSGSIRDCPVVSGLTKGATSCSCLEFLLSQCQSTYERTFLDLYLRFNKDKESPMPIPQCSVDPLDRYRSDFVLIAKSKRNHEWEWLSIEIDPPQYHQNVLVDVQKDSEVKRSGFRTIRIRVEGVGSMTSGVREVFNTLENL
jgi:hypothetical protein